MSEPDVDRLLMLAKALLVRTMSGDIRWTPTARDDAFSFSGSDASVIVATADQDGQPPYNLSLYDDKGTMVERVHSDEADWGLLHDLYPAARRSALDIDRLVESLISDVEAGGARETKTKRSVEAPVPEYDDLPF